jgi:hypothetical protein
VKKRSKEPPVAPQPGGLVLLVDSLFCGLDASSWVSLRGLATEEQLEASSSSPDAPQPGGLVLLVASLSCGLDASSWVSLRGLATEEQLEASCSSSPDVSLPGAVVERGLGQPAASCAAYTDGTTQAKER